LPGVTEVTGDLSAATLLVSFDPAQVKQDELITATTQAVEELGYSIEGTFAP
jgi:copper chaperone CopZ